MNDIEFKLAVSDAETIKHIHEVSASLSEFASELLNRGKHHDKSKLESPEREIFANKHSELANTEYGTPEYKSLLEGVRPAIEHHYAKNRHHPQHWPNGINDMTLVDLVEMLCDWKAATKRNKNGNIRKSIEINAQKFNISPQLKQIFENTVREMFPED